MDKFNMSDFYEPAPLRIFIPGRRNPETHIVHFLGIMRSQGISTISKQKHEFKRTLESAELEWYLRELQKDLITDEVSFKDVFIKKFKVNPSKAYKYMKARIQEPQESIHEYFFDKLDLCVAIDIDREMSEREKIQHIIQGLLPYYHYTLWYSPTRYEKVNELRNFILRQEENKTLAGIHCPAVTKILALEKDFEEFLNISAQNRVRASSGIDSDDDDDDDESDEEDEVASKVVAKEEDEDEDENDAHDIDGSILNDPKRVILLLDVDCFEVQVWIRNLRPDLIEKDVPVVVINSGQIILSVNYTAKSLGVVRGEGRRALRKAHVVCIRAGFELIEITVPERYGKVDSFLPLVEGNLILKAVLNHIQKFKNNIPSIIVERNCKDELFIDVSTFVEEKFKSCENLTVNETSICIPPQAEMNCLIQLRTHPNERYNDKPIVVMEGLKSRITGQELCYRVQHVYLSNFKAYHLNEIRLVHGAIIAHDIIEYIKKETGYDVSAGVAHSKIVAKIACGFNKPKGVTIITDISLSRLSKKIRFQDLQGFGGKKGHAVQNYLSSKGGTDAHSINEMMHATNNGVDLEDIFRKLRLPDCKELALDLLNKCQFKDESLVISKVHPDKVGTFFHFKDGCQRKDVLFQGILNISKDMKESIDYYQKELGRVAQKLVVKFEVNGTSSENPRLADTSVPICTLQYKTDQFVSHESICDFILYYIRNNNLDFKQISKIHLTARQFQEIIGPQSQSVTSSEGNVRNEVDTVRTNQSKGQEGPSSAERNERDASDEAVNDNENIDSQTVTANTAEIEIMKPTNISLLDTNAFTLFRKMVDRKLLPGENIKQYITDKLELVKAALDDPYPKRIIMEIEYGLSSYYQSKLSLIPKSEEISEVSKLQEFLVLQESIKYACEQSLEASIAQINKRMGLCHPRCKLWSN